MKVILQPNEGERILLSAPLCGEIVIKTDPAIAGDLMAMAMQTLPSGGVIPVHRYLQHPLFIWIFKGQGRVVVDNHPYTVVPGHSLVVPAGQWYGLRNTGTGLLQVVWVGPASLVAFFRSLSQASQPVDQAALAALSQPHGIEFQTDSEALLAPKPRAQRRPFRQRHRGGGSRQPKPAQEQSSSAAEQAIASSPLQPQTTPPAPIETAAVPETAHQHPNRRFRGRHRRNPRAPSQEATPAQPPAAPVSAKPSAAASRPTARRPGGRKPSRYGHSKEVFMGGKWVRVSGEGPIIASGD